MIYRITRKRGAGREIINKLYDFLKNERVKTKRLVTLSPLTNLQHTFILVMCKTNK